MPKAIHHFLISIPVSLAVGGVAYLLAEELSRFHISLLWAAILVEPFAHLLVAVYSSLLTFVASIFFLWSKKGSAAFVTISLIFSVCALAATNNLVDTPNGALWLESAFGIGLLISTNVSSVVSVIYLDPTYTPPAPDYGPDEGVFKVAAFAEALFHMVWLFVVWGLSLLGAAIHTFISVRRLFGTTTLFASSIAFGLTCILIIVTLLAGTLYKPDNTKA